MVILDFEVFLTYTEEKVPYHLGEAHSIVQGFQIQAQKVEVLTDAKEVSAKS